MSEKKSKIDNNLKLKARVDKDLIVHNMPLASKSKASDLGHSEKSLGFKVDNVSQKHKFKTLGLLIILGGLIFIFILIYLSYVFIIKPALKPKANSLPTQGIENLKTKPETENISDKKKVLNPNDLIPLASSTLVNTNSSSTILNLASSSEIISASNDSQELKNLQASSTVQKNVNNLPPLLDSDHDGLNDLEELVLGTAPNSSDTNDNTYSDLVEINNNYNPIGTGSLNDDQKLTSYYNNIFAYQVLYPKDFLLSSVNNGETVIFTAPDNSLIQISSQENSQQENILDWYQKLFPKVVINPDQVKTTKTWTGIIGEDNLNFYLTDRQKAHFFIISYIPAVSKRIVYPNIFKLMVNYFVVK